MNFKLVAMDFDGTLLNDEKKVSERTKLALQKCREKGCKIVGVTARALNSVLEVLPVSMFDYLLLNNGAYLYDVNAKSGKILGFLSRKMVEQITNEVDSHSVQIDYVSCTTYYISKRKKNSNCAPRQGLII